MTCTAHKFGGASVRDAEAIKRLADLLHAQLGSEGRAIVVVSAMGKTTNALEEIWRAKGEPRLAMWDSCVEKHLQVAEDLNLPAATRQKLQDRMQACWVEALRIESDGVIDVASKQAAASYDAFVAAGELASTTLVEGWLQASGIVTTWWDVRDTLATTGPHRFARVDESQLQSIGAPLREVLDGSSQIVVTQGFIGRHADGRTSTLGREGSDYSAALLAVACSAASVTIWKDVPGMMNADPKRHPDAVTVPQVDHAEALELSYYGASVIHPRTVKPLQQAGIPLHVKSFLDPKAPSTCIDAYPGLVPEVPMFIWRDDQSWMEVYTADGSFLVEDHLTALFGALDRAGIHVRLMQQSATHFGLLIDRDDDLMANFTGLLGPGFWVDSTHGLTLLTVRHGDEKTLARLTASRTVKLEQRTASTWRRVLE